MAYFQHQYGVYKLVSDCKKPVVQLPGANPGQAATPKRVEITRKAQYGSNFRFSAGYYVYRCKFIETRSGELFGEKSREEILGDKS